MMNKKHPNVIYLTLNNNDKYYNFPQCDKNTFIISSSSRLKT